MKKFSLIIIGIAFSCGLCTKVYSATNQIYTNLKSDTETTQCIEKHFLYVTHPLAGKITQFQIESTTGDLIKQAEYLTVASPGDLVIQQNKYLYTFGNYDGTIMVYSIATDGSLTQIQTLKNILANYAFNITFDHDGNYMYLGNSNRNDIAMFKVNKDNGLLYPLNPFTIPSQGPYPAGISMNPNSSKFVYITNYWNNTVSVYIVDSVTHGLIPLNKSYPTGTFPRFAWFDTNNHAYVLNLQSNDISMFHANTQTGELTPLSIPTVKAGAEPITFALSPSEKYVYVGNRVSSDILVYAKDSDGILAQIDNISTIESSATHGSKTRNIVIDTINHTSYLYASNSSGSSIVKFILNSDGLIEPSSIIGQDTGVSNPEVMAIAHIKNCN
ncbi:MAG: lactonase family protein [Neisseriaceae bacterium]